MTTLRNRSRPFSGLTSTLAVALAAGLACLVSPAVAQPVEDDLTQDEAGNQSVKPEAVTPPSDRAEPLPPELEGVGIEEKLGERVPVDIKLIDSEGRNVSLGDYLGRDKPVILNIGYYGCPMLCGLVMNGMVDAMREIKMTAGEEYEVLTVSIDPGETTMLARLKKQNYVQELGDPAAAAGWHFLTGDADETRRLADAVGFNYRWNDRRKEWAHAAVLIILTPDGRVSRYLYGVSFPSTTVRLSLVEASDGEIGSAMDQFLLFCFHYDAAERKYAVAALNFMRLGAAVTITVLFGALGMAFRREAKRRAAGEGAVT